MYVYIFQNNEHVSTNIQSVHSKCSVSTRVLSNAGSMIKNNHKGCIQRLMLDKNVHNSRLHVSLSRVNLTHLPSKVSVSLIILFEWIFIAPFNYDLKHWGWDKMTTICSRHLKLITLPIDQFGKSALLRKKADRNRTKMMSTIKVSKSIARGVLNIVRGFTSTLAKISSSCEAKWWH